MSEPATNNQFPSEAKRKPKGPQVDGTEFLTAASLAQRWGVRQSTVWRWAKDGKIPQPTKLGPQVTKWRRTDIEAHEQPREARA